MPAAQAALSEQPLSRVQRRASLARFWQPVAGSQRSRVQSLLSSQSGALLASQAPPTPHPVSPQSSARATHALVLPPIVRKPAHATPPPGLSCLAVAGVGGAAVAVVADPLFPEHSAFSQRSLSVQGAPSSHGLALATCTQPLLGAQLSSVQGLLSSQPLVGPTQAPAPLQLVKSVHAFPSLQPLPMPVSASAHLPVFGSHLAARQSVSSSLLQNTFDAGLCLQSGTFKDLSQK